MRIRSSSTTSLLWESTICLVALAAIGMTGVFADDFPGFDPTCDNDPSTVVTFTEDGPEEFTKTCAQVGFDRNCWGMLVETENPVWFVCQLECPFETGCFSRAPSHTPTKAPTRTPTEAPTKSPTKTPTKSPTKSPSKSPTNAPSDSPTTSPSKAPTVSPTRSPTKAPSFHPTPKPTPSPTIQPTRLPTTSPTKQPTFWPTIAPTERPSKSPTMGPTTAPTQAPTRSPTESPTAQPTEATPAPTEQTPQPVATPAPQVSIVTNAPTVTPTARPIAQRVDDIVTEEPTALSTRAPTRSPTSGPTRAPTRQPTMEPTRQPSGSPTTEPSVAPSTPLPSKAPTQIPTVAPSTSPSEPEPQLSQETPARTMEVNGLTVILRNAATLSPPELAELEALMEDWFSNYYDGESCQQRRRQRHLQRIRDDRVINTDIEFVRQDVTYDENGVPTNTITYNQEITYADGSSETIVCGAGPEPVNLEDLTPQEVAALPFEDFGYSQELVEEVQEKIEALRSADIVSQTTNGNDDGLSAVVLAIIVILGAGGLIAIAYAAIKFMPRKPQAPATQQDGALVWDG